jgi:predicted nuclease with TOPRIM domain
MSGVIRKGEIDVLEMLEKLINEHGSSTILRERLELFSDKYSMLEEKLKSSEQRNAALESENKKLSEQIGRLEKEFDQLHGQFESAAQAAKQKLKNEQKNIWLFSLILNSPFGVQFISILAAA